MSAHASKLSICRIVLLFVGGALRYQATGATGVQGHQSVTEASTFFFSPLRQESSRPPRVVCSKRCRLEAGKGLVAPRVLIGPDRIRRHAARM